MQLKARLLSLWDNVRSSYWFTPTLLGVAAVLLSILTLSIDQMASGELFQDNPWFYTGSADGARRLERVLTNDPGTGIMRHADAGSDRAVEVARQRGVRLPRLEP